MRTNLSSNTKPNSWREIVLGELVFNIRQTAQINDNDKYELWSIPSFSDGVPEYVRGDQIGSGKLLVQQDDVLISKINPRINGSPT